MTDTRPSSRPAESHNAAGQVLAGRPGSHPREELLRRAVRVAVLSWIARDGPPLEPEDGSRWRLPSGRVLTWRKGVWSEESEPPASSGAEKPGGRLRRFVSKLLGKFARGSTGSSGGPRRGPHDPVEARNGGLTGLGEDSDVPSRPDADRPSDSDTSGARERGGALGAPHQGGAQPHRKGGR